MPSNSLSRVRDQANNALQNLLLALEPRDSFRSSKAWEELYYSSSSLKAFNRRADAFKAAHSETYISLAPAISAYVTAWEACEAARLVEKARLVAKREAIASRKAAKKDLGVDLKKHEFATPATYKTLRAALEPVKVSVRAHYVEKLTQRANQLRERAGTDYRINFVGRNSYTGKPETTLPDDFWWFFDRSTYKATPFEIVNRGDLTLRIADKAEEAAEAEISSFSGKLAGKIDREAEGKQLVSAVVSGDTLWEHSALKATLSDGSVQFWNTQIIWNRSCLGTSFNQWPTRRT